MNSGFDIFLILMIVVLNCIKASIQSSFSRKYVGNNNDAFLFTGIFFLAISVFLRMIFSVDNPSGQALFLVISGAVMNASFQITYLMAFNSGPVSLTALFSNLSIFIPVIFGIAVFDENVTVYHIIGIILLVASLILGVGKAEKGKGISKRWVVTIIFCMLSNGAANCVQRYYRETAGAENAALSTGYLVYSYFLAAIIIFVIYFISNCKNKEEKREFRLPFLYFGAATGLILGIYQKIYMYALGAIDSVFLLPMQSGLVTVAMSVIGIVFYKDRLSVKQKIGVILGLLCVVTMNLK